MLNGPNADLQKDLAEYSIRLLSKDRAKDHSHTIVAGLDVNGLFFPIVNRHDLPTFSQPFGSRLGCEFRGRFLELVELIKGPFERSSHSVTLQQGDSTNEIISGFYEQIIINNNDGFGLNARHD